MKDRGLNEEMALHDSTDNRGSAADRGRAPRPPSQSILWGPTFLVALAVFSTEVSLLFCFAFFFFRCWHKLFYVATAQSAS